MLLTVLVFVLGIAYQLGGILLMVWASEYPPTAPTVDRLMGDGRDTLFLRPALVLLLWPLAILWALLKAFGKWLVVSDLK